MHALVTGATGFIGGRLARFLTERGVRVQALVREPARARGPCRATITGFDEALGRALAEERG